MVWAEGTLAMLDQRLLPREERWLDLRTWEQVADAIHDMAVRGAPAIGVASAYGMALAAVQGADRSVADAGLRATRPTAVNLFWALDRIASVSECSPEAILAEARAIEAEDEAMCERIAANGVGLVPAGSSVLTICNTGALATAGVGTALGIVRRGWQEGRIAHVFACETRPRMQGLRLTAWELMQEGISFEAIADGAAAALMAKGRVGIVLAGADRIAANGDTANKLGTYSLAVLARHHGVPFVVAAPSSTIDASSPDGSAIVIEERAAEEITEIEGVRVAPTNCPVWNPAFDVTPGSLIDAIVDERAVYRPPFAMAGDR